MSFKSSMANYYHEARAQVKKIKVLQEEGKKRAEKRAELMAPVAPNPHNQLFVTGTSCKLQRGADAHAANEAGDNLVPWNGDAGNMIDRFDVRALLDFYKEPNQRVIAARHKAHEEQKLEETLLFESYRDLVRLVSRGITEAQGLNLVDQESLNRRAAEHAAVQAANDAVYNNPRPGGAAAGGPGTIGPSGVPAGSGVYSAMGFSYDTAAAGPAGAGAAAADSSDSDSDDLDSDDEAAANEMLSEADMAQEAEDDRVDEIAEGFGLQDFAYRLHRTLEKEGEDEARMRKRPKKRMSRKKAANRAKRMTGMGLNPATGLPFHQHDPYGDPRALINPWEVGQQQPPSPDRPGYRRGSPTYDGGGWSTRSRSASPRAPGDRQYITEFLSEAGNDKERHSYMDRQQPARAGIIEALPDRPDPAMLGGIQPVAKEVLTVQGIKREDLHKRLKLATEDESPTYSRRSPTPPRRSRRAGSRSRSRDRARSRSRSRGRRRSITPPWRKRAPDRSPTPPWRKKAAARSPTPPWRSSKRASSRSRSRSRDRYRGKADSHRRHSSRSRSRDRDSSRHKRSSDDRRRSSDDGAKYASSKGGDGGTAGDGGGSRSAAAGSGRASAVGGGGSASAPKAAAVAAAVKETPQERLKRLMQAQLNKAAQKDSLANAQKQIQLEKEKVARQQLERVAMAAGRGRGRTPSPDGYDDHGRSP